MLLYTTNEEVKDIDPTQDTAENTTGKKKKSRIFCIVLSAMFIIVGFATIAQYAVAGISFVLFGALLLPYSRDFINKFIGDDVKKRKIARIAYILVLVVLFIVAGASLPASESSNRGGKNNSGVMSETEKEEALKSAVRGGVSFEILTRYDATFKSLTISTIDTKGDVYTAYGKVTVTDKYGDLYTGNFTAVYRFDSNTQEFDKVSVEVDPPYKH